MSLRGVTKNSEEQPQPSRYVGIGYDELVTYAIWTLVQREADPTFEAIVAECFTLFPARFHLTGYPQWPDSSRVNKSWLRCRTDKGYVVGRVKQGFTLTPKGIETAHRIHATLRGERPSKRLRSRSDRATKEGSLLAELEKSTVFMEFAKSGDTTSMSEYDFRDALLCTMETPPAVLLSNLRQFEAAALVYERSTVIEFLSQLREQFANILSPDARKFQGGMMRRKISNERARK